MNENPANKLKSKRKKRRQASAGSARLNRRFVPAAVLGGAAFLILSACIGGKDPGAELVPCDKLECFRHSGNFKVGFSKQEAEAETPPAQDSPKTSQAEEITYFNESHPDRESCEAKIREMKERDCPAPSE